MASVVKVRGLQMPLSMVVWPDQGDLLTSVKPCAASFLPERALALPVTELQTPQLNDSALGIFSLRCLQLPGAFSRPVKFSLLTSA